MKVLNDHQILSTDLSQHEVMHQLEEYFFNKPWSKTRGILLSTITTSEDMAVAEDVIRDITADERLNLLMCNPSSLLNIVELSDEDESELTSDDATVELTSDDDAELARASFHQEQPRR